MKPKPYSRIIFTLLVVVGSLLFLQGARKVAAENFEAPGKICNACTNPGIGESNTEFIFFELVTKYLIVSLIR